MPIKVKMIVACAENGAIGRNNTIPWKMKDDMKFFKEQTIKRHVVMGRKTAESLGKPLIDRVCVVMTQDREKGLDLLKRGFVVSADFEFVVPMLEYPVIAYHLDWGNPCEIVIIGGSQIYDLALKSGVVDEILYTEVHTVIEDADAFFEFDRTGWTKEILRERQPKDDRNEYDYTIFKFTKSK